MPMEFNANPASTSRYFEDFEWLYLPQKLSCGGLCQRRGHGVIKINQLLPLGSMNVHTKCHADPDMKIKSIVHIL